MSPATVDRSALARGRRAISCQRIHDASALLTLMLQSEHSVAAQRGSSTKVVMARLRARVAARCGGERR